jgi:hypothetical protein
MLRRIAATLALGLAALWFAALAYALVPQTGVQGPRSATLTPGAAALLEELGRESLHMPPHASRIRERVGGDEG